MFEGWGDDFIHKLISQTLWSKDQRVRCLCDWQLFAYVVPQYTALRM